MDNNNASAVNNFFLFLMTYTFFVFALMMQYYLYLSQQKTNILMNKTIHHIYYIYTSVH